ncbi:MAG: hypothetical protein ACREQV_26005, partial [Candidatus Binatia bacterium]
VGMALVSVWIIADALFDLMDPQLLNRETAIINLLGGLCCLGIAVCVFFRYREMNSASIHSMYFFIRFLSRFPWMLILVGTLLGVIGTLMIYGAIAELVGRP